MAFITYNDIENLIPEAIAKLIAEPTKFAYYENLTAKIIRDESGIAIPTSPATAPDWIILPAAHIITKIASNKIIGLKVETIQRIDDDYKNAIKTLRNHVNKGIDTPLTFARTGQISKVAVW